ncbi:MAG: HAD-IIB family hydrolase [Erysipelothrix sp.]|nr:HAD-IIB family hydrolase [Erysipelothrix sp.]
MKPIKGYIFIDIDGTLVDKDLRLNSYDIESIHKALAHDYDVILASGRPTPFVRWMAHQIHESVSVCGFNGADIEGTLLGCIDDTVIKILSNLDLNMIFKNQSGYYSNRLTIPQAFNYDMIGNYPRQMHPLSDILKVLIWVDAKEYDTVKRMLDSIEDISITYYEPKGFELSAKGIDKGKAIIHYVQDNIPIYSIGNDTNDLPMFEVSDASYIVGNKLTGHRVESVSEAIIEILKGGNIE